MYKVWNKLYLFQIILIYNKDQIQKSKCDRGGHTSISYYLIYPKGVLRTD